jgi:cell division protein FtsW (lipid II flippase)
MNRQKSSPRFRFVGAAALLVLLALLAPALREGDQRLYLLAGGVTGVMLLCMIVPARLFSLDRLILSLALYLGAVGILSLAPANPDAALMQLLRCSVGVVALIIGAMIIRIITPSMLTAGISSFLGLLFLAGSLLVRDLPFSLTEAALILMVISFSSLLACHSGTVALIPGLIGTVLLLLQGMTVEAFVLALTVLLLLWSADGRLGIVLAALSVFVAMFWGAERLGYLPALASAEEHSLSLSTLVSAGLFGSGEAAVLPESALPVSSLLYPLSENYGLVFTGLTLLLYLPLMLRGASVAGTARSRFHAVLALGCVLIFSLRIPAGLLAAFNVLPLPLTPLPLLTDSLPNLAAQMLTLGLLCGISSVNEADLAEDAHLAMLAK